MPNPDLIIHKFLRAVDSRIQSALQAVPTFETGIIEAVNPDGSVGVTMNGESASVTALVLDSYTPKLGDSVEVRRQNGVLTVFGSIAQADLSAVSALPSGTIIKSVIWTVYSGGIFSTTSTAWTNWTAFSSFNFKKLYGNTNLTFVGASSAYMNTTNYVLTGVKDNFGGSVVQLGRFFFNQLSTHETMGMAGVLAGRPAGVCSLQACIATAAGTVASDQNDYWVVEVKEVVP